MVSIRITNYDEDLLSALYVLIDPSSRERTAYVNMTRYITYLGLCVATCIIFQRNMVAASAIGLAVGLYITVAEYFLQQEQSNQSETSPIDMSQLQDLFT